MQGQRLRRGLAGIAIWASAFDAEGQDRSAGAFIEPSTQSTEMKNFKTENLTCSAAHAECYHYNT